VYATGSNEDGIAHQLVKFDLNSKRHEIWKCKGCYPTEPIFVAKPCATDEDDGIILSLVLDAIAQTSFLLILDAKTFKELGRASVPHHIPFTVHSKFFTTN
jgi:carotenoid cleavage dioxygenase-like enzyme